MSIGIDGLKIIISFEPSSPDQYFSTRTLKPEWETEKLYRKDFEPYYHKINIISADGMEILDTYSPPTPLWKWKGSFIPGTVFQGTLDGENVVLLLKVNDTYIRIYENDERK